VIGAMLCTRTDEELLKELKSEILYSKMVSCSVDGFISYGNVQ
jgi:hypothetical protein